MRTLNSMVYAHIGTEKIVRLYHEGLSARKIGKLLGMGPCAVGNRLRKNGIRGGHVLRVTNQQLRDARLDQALEARLGISDRVICRECGELKAGINANGEHSHLRCHNMTVEQYTGKYPGARFFSFATASGQARRQGRKTSLEKRMQQYAAKYLTAAELRRCRRDPFWERHHGITDFVVCRRCGLKIGFSNLSGHVRRDGYPDLGAYRADFPDVPSTATGYKVRYLRPYAKERYAKMRSMELKPKRTRGRPARTELFTRAKELKRAGHSWPQCAEMLCPGEVQTDGRAVVAERLRKGSQSY